MSASMDRDLSGRDGVYHVAVQRTGKRASKLNGELNNNSSCVSVLPMELTVDDSIYQNN